MTTRGTTSSMTGLHGLRAGALAWLVAAVLLAIAVSGARAAPVPLRQVNWEAVLANDPYIEAGETEPFLPDLGPFVTVHFGQSDVFGHADFEGILYVDLDRDGAEEAVLPLESGGTAGTTGFLVYREAEPRPALVAAEPGYKLYFTIEDGALVVNEASYVGFEPNCCPSARVLTSYILRGNRLTSIGERVLPNPVQALTVEAFYRALDSRDFEAAYAFLSRSFRAANPFDRWVEGYATTTGVSAETRPGPSEDEVAITIRAVDRTSGGGTVTRPFEGVWTVIWSPDERRWLLDRARIAEAP